MSTGTFVCDSCKERTNTIFLDGHLCPKCAGPKITTRLRSWLEGEDENKVSTDVEPPR